jgi:hypothetical protein
MKKVDTVLKKLSELYEFNRELNRYRIKSAASQSQKKDAPKNRRAF